MYIHTYIHMYIHTYICIYIHTYVQTYIHTSYADSKLPTSVEGDVGVSKDAFARPLAAGDVKVGLIPLPPTLLIPRIPPISLPPPYPPLTFATAVPCSPSPRCSVTVKRIVSQCCVSLPGEEEDAPRPGEKENAPRPGEEEEAPRRSKRITSCTRFCTFLGLSHDPATSWYSFSS